VLRLLSAPSGRFWQQTAICPVSLWALVVSKCSSTTNAHSRMGQMAVCQNLPLGALSRSAPSVLVGALFKKFGLFLNVGAYHTNWEDGWQRTMDGDEEWIQTAFSVMSACKEEAKSTSCKRLFNH
jgi:hypothetical protein